MTSIIKKENGRQPASFGNVVDQIFQNNLSRFFDDTFWGFNGLERNRIPVNIRETDKEYEMQLVAPGLKKEDFHLNVTGDTLTVSFEHKQEEETGNEGWLQQEFRKQSFSRSFQLGDTIDTRNIKARYDNGILYLVLPKNEKSQKLSTSIKVE